MATYSPLFSLQAEHSFFRDNLCRSLDFVPTPSTSSVMGNAGLLTRSSSSGINVFYESARAEALRMYAGNTDEPLNLSFKVFTVDPRFWNYTEPSAYKDGAMLYFDNSDAQPGDDGRLRLHSDEFAGDSNFEDIGSPKVSGIVKRQDGLLRPVFVVSISVAESDVTPPDNQAAVAPKSYYVRFQARHTFWKYYLLGELAKEDFYVNDQDEAIEFVAVGESSLADNRTALAFISKTLLPLREKSQYRFQLRDKNSGGGRILIRRLPVASASHISKEVIDGEVSLVSEMFINR
jgi:hypothetical protein